VEIIVDAVAGGEVIGSDPDLSAGVGGRTTKQFRGFEDSHRPAPQSEAQGSGQPGNPPPATITRCSSTDARPQTVPPGHAPRRCPTKRLNN